MNYEKTASDLAARGQEHLLAYYGELGEEEKKRLLSQIEAIKWDEIALWKNPRDLSGKGKITPIPGLKISEISARRAEFQAIGAEAVKEHKVGAVLLAGGQGTRLGSDAPKGAYDVGLTRPVYIFERLICNLSEVCEKFGAYVPLYIMTSDKNDKETRAFLAEHNFFGYPEEYIAFFVQDMAASVDFTGKILLEEKDRLALSPNGNGGWYSSLIRAGLLTDAEARGVEWFNVFAVDNVLQRIADPAFIGAAIESGVNCAAKGVRKTAPEERVGVLCLEDGLPNVIEYYELSEEMAHARNKDGSLLYSDGVILNYLFRASKLKEISAKKIPVHVAKKKIPFLDGAGNKVFPDAENGYKFETLILDMIKLMGSCLPYEVEREKEFAPIKNKTGTDSVETARELLRRNGVVL